MKLLWLFPLFAACSYHTNSDYLASTRPLMAPYVMTEQFEEEQCRWFLFTVFPLDPFVSPGDVLDEVAARGPLVTVRIETRDQYILFLARKRCHKVNGFLVVDDA